MFMHLFCLDCTDTIQDPQGNLEACPFCGSKNIVEDKGHSSNDEEHIDWDDGHFEGDMSGRAPLTDRDE